MDIACTPPKVIPTLLVYFILRIGPVRLEKLSAFAKAAKTVLREPASKSSSLSMGVAMRGGGVGRLEKYTFLKNTSSLRGVPLQNLKSRFKSLTNVISKGRPRGVGGVTPSAPPIRGARSSRTEHDESKHTNALKSNTRTGMIINTDVYSEHFERLGKEKRTGLKLLASMNCEREAYQVE